MAKPVRLQLSRKKGFDLQAHSLSVNGLPAVNVARPTKWGNPHKVTGFRSVQECVDRFRADIEAMTIHSPRFRGQLSELTGKNLACWCKPGDACHADVLLELANPLPEGKE